MYSTNCHSGYFGCVTSLLCAFEKQSLITAFLTVYPPQAVRQVILAVDRLVAGGDVAEIAGLLHAVWWREGLEGEEAVVAVHLRWYICQRQKWFQKQKTKHATAQPHAVKNRPNNFK